jgi:hypothetical protein
VISILYAEWASATNNKGDKHMLLTEARISTTQTFGIAGLTRSELHEVQSFLEALRKFNSDIESASKHAGGVEGAPGRSQPDEIERNITSADDGVALQPGHPLACRNKAKTPRSKSKTRPMETYARKERAITASLMRRAKRGEFLAIRNLFVLLPNTPTKVDAEPDTRLGG